jgi:ADP-heptose:LPS heptosyltransferase
MAAYPTAAPTAREVVAVATPAAVISPCANPLPRAPAADRVLLVRLGAIGDVVRTLPAASALRGAYAGAHLAWRVGPASRSAVEGQPWVDEVLVFPRGEIEALLRRGRLIAAAAALFRFVGMLRRRRFDLVIDFHAILKTGLLGWASGAPRRASYAMPFGREGAWLFANLRARIAPRRISRFERNRGLLDFVARGAVPSARPFRLDRAVRARMAEALGAGPAPVAIHPGTSAGTPHKRWSADGYAAVARLLRDAVATPSIVLFGPDPRERALAEAIVAQADGAARLAPVTASLGELAALLALCGLYLGGDTGPMHVASLVGTPVVQILGPTDPVENRPYPGTPSRTVREPVACSPCRRGCATATCLRLVTPDAVFAAARDLLAVPPRGR